MFNFSSAKNLRSVEVDHTLTTHELAQHLLSFPNLPVVLNHSSGYIAVLEEGEVLYSPNKADVGHRFVSITSQEVLDEADEYTPSFIK